MAALVVAATGACSVTNPTALTVGSWTLSQSDFLATLEKVSAKPAVAKNFDQTFTGAGTGASSSGTTPVAYPTSLTAAMLSAFVQYRIWTDEAARQGITITDQQREAMKASITSQLSGASSSGAAAATPSSATAEDLGPLLPVVIDGLIAENAIADRLLDPNEVATQARQLFDANKDQLTKSCASVIYIVPPSALTSQQAPPAAEIDAQKARADQVRARLDGGADFATVAKSDSDEPQSKAQGGEVGCLGQSDVQNLPQDQADALFTAPVGTITGPLRTEAGWLIVKVTDRQIPTYDQYKDRVEAQVKQQLGQTVRAGAFQKAATGVAVTVNPLYGTWDAASLQVAPPAGAQAPPTTAPAGGLGSGGFSLRTGPDGQPQVVGPDGQPVDVSALGGGSSSPGASSSGAASASGRSSGAASTGASSSSGASSSGASPASSTPASSTPSTSAATTAGTAARP
ncbi:MAG: peptidylprolyl isomerase [Acidimicrobiales bacterium]